MHTGSPKEATRCRCKIATFLSIGSVNAAEKIVFGQTNVLRTFKNLSLRLDQNNELAQMG